MINTTAAQADSNSASAIPASSNMIDRLNLSALWVRLKVSATAIWSAAASEARRRFGLGLCPIHLKASLSSQSGVALRLPPHSIKSRSVTDSFNHTRPLLLLVLVLGVDRMGAHAESDAPSTKPPAICSSFFSSQPLHFELNRGQAEGPARFL